MPGGVVPEPYRDARRFAHLEIEHQEGAVNRIRLRPSQIEPVENNDEVVPPHRVLAADGVRAGVLDQGNLGFNRCTAVRETPHADQRRPRRDVQRIQDIQRQAE